MARVTDFLYTIYNPPQQHPEWEERILGKAVFGVRGDKDGGDDDFWDALSDLKRINYKLRSYDDQKREWTVLVTGSTRKLLCDTFRNAEGLIEEVENQLPLPWENGL